MSPLTVSEPKRLSARRGNVASTVLSIQSVLRGLPLLFAERPKTPLRVLCIIAFDTLHRLQTSHRLSAIQLRMLAALLDFGACANAVVDNKTVCLAEFQKSRQLVEDAGGSQCVREYLRRLRKLERRRPSPGGDEQQFQKVRTYREAVVRLSLGMIASTVCVKECLDDGIRATHCDEDLETLFRIVMQCQIIDDLLDYSKDTSAGLPGFLTASASLQQALELTRRAAYGYATVPSARGSGGVFPLRVALLFVSAFARVLIFLGEWRRRVWFAQQISRPASVS